MSMDNRIDKLNQIVYSQPVIVLVYGSSSGDTKHYWKREKIKGELKNRYPNGKMNFSEDSELDEYCKYKIQVLEHFPIRDKEFVHVMLCHLCIMLDVSKGPGEEIVLMFAKQLGHKLFVLTHEKFIDENTFPGSMRKNLDQEFCTDAEFDSCSLVDRALARVYKIAADQAGIS